jgi:hypothetical protein
MVNKNMMNKNMVNKSMVNKIIIVVFIVFGLCAMTACTSHDKNSFSLSNTSSDPQMLRQPHRFLQKHLKFSQKDLLIMEQGKVVAKVFDKSTVENEVGAFGIVRLNIPKEYLVENFRDIVTFKESPEVKAIGKFSNPPQIEDIQGLTLDSEDLKALENCQPGDCKVKMDTIMMERFQKDVDWSAPDYKEQATVLMRRILVDYVKTYLNKGDTAMGEYHDQEYPLRIADAFHGLLRNSPYLCEHVPELYTYLQEFPNGQLSNVENFVYWSKEAFGLKPVINLFHVTIYTRKQQHSTDIFITSKQIYASHYFEASLGFTAFIDEVGGEEPPDAYLMYLNRSRFDQLQGSLKGLIVTIGKGKVYDGVKKYFRQVKERLEAGPIEEVQRFQERYTTIGSNSKILTILR